MLGKSVASPLSTFVFTTHFPCSTSDIGKDASTLGLSNRRSYVGLPTNINTRCRGISCFSSRKWAADSTAQAENISTMEEDPKTWEVCREALSSFNFSIEEKDKILGKAFGHVHTPYWYEERKKETPKPEIVNETLNFLRSLNLSDDDLYKILKKFPEVLGCDLEQEVKNNVQVLEKDWGIKGKTLRNLLLRNPKVLGYNVDCRGDCMAKCTRCWVRF